MNRIPPWLCMLPAVLWSAGCSDDLHVQFGGDASFGHDAGDAGGADDDGGGDAVGTKDAGGGASGDEDGGVTSAPGHDAGTTMSPAPAFPRQLALALCDALASCYGSPKLLADVLGGRDCARLNTGELAASDLAYLSQSIAAGLVELHRDRIADCLTDVRALGCDARASRLPLSCKAAFAGKGLAASECTTHLDCMGDAFCDKGAMATCPGVCASLQAEGAACNNNDDAQCQDGLVCFRGSCEALGVLGQQCGADLPGCKPGLSCLDQGNGLECVAIDTLYSKKLGEDCNTDSALCVPGLVCESVSGKMGKCAETVTRGASCKRALPNQCPLEQYCDAMAAGETGTCVDRPGDGQACLTRTPACADGHACIDTTCRAIHGNDEACAGPKQCYSGTCTGGLCEGALMCAPP